MNRHDRYVVIGKKNCPWCDKALGLINTKTTDPVNYIAIETHPDILTLMDGLGITTVPVIWYADEYDHTFIGGYQNLVEWLEVE